MEYQSSMTEARARPLTNHLTLRHLRMVVAIVEEGNLVRAARRLNMTQSAVTKALQEVEALTGAHLFDRTNRGVLPTLFGDTLAEHARLVLAQLQSAGEHLADLRDGKGGRVAIGTLLAASAELLPRAIAQLRRERPKLVVKVVEGTSDVLIPALRAGEIDLFIGRLSERAETPNLKQEVLTRDFACVVVRRGHPLAGRASVSLAELARWEWILPPPETNMRRQIDITFLEEGLDPPAHAVDSVSLLTYRQLLLAADYLGVFPAQVARHEASLGGLVILPVSLRATAGLIGITTRANMRLSPAAEVFIQTLRDVAADTGA
jgi:DNA-binding transcriptional LysR family regulator